MRLDTRELFWLILPATLALSACGGGGDDTTLSAASPVTATTNASSTGADREAALAVAPVAGSLVGRAWTPPQALESDANPVLEQRSAIDDAGHVMVVYKKTTPARNVIYATRITPGATGISPVFTAPLVIDTRGGVPLTSVEWNSGIASIGLATSANGNAVAVWTSKAACSPTSYMTGGTCNYIQSARYLASTGKWESPIQVSSSFIDVDELFINDRGDIALRFTGFIRSGLSGYKLRPAVAWKAGNQLGFTQTVFADDPLVTRLALDNSGGLIVATTSRINAITEVHAYRGNVTSGLGAAQTLATNIATSGFRGLSVGLNGQQLLLWRTSDSDSSLTAATATSATAAFAVKRLNWSPRSTPYSVMTDSGTALVYDFYGQAFLKWSGNQWSTAQVLGGAGSPRITAGLVPAFARNGNFLAVEDGSGLWATYDFSRNVFVQRLVNASPGTGYVLGITTTNKVVGMADPLLSISGIGAVTMNDVYTSLPSATVPLGVKGPVNNLWGVYLK